MRAYSFKHWRKRLPHHLPIQTIQTQHTKKRFKLCQVFWYFIQMLKDDKKMTKRWLFLMKTWYEKCDEKWWFSEKIQIQFTICMILCDYFIDFIKVQRIQYQKKRRLGENVIFQSFFSVWNVYIILCLKDFSMYLENLIADFPSYMWSHHQ